MSTRWTSGRCPACGSTITGQQRRCWTCGLDLVADELAKIAYTTRFLGWARGYRLLDERAHARLRRELDQARGGLTGGGRLPVADVPAPERAGPAEPGAAATDSAQAPSGWGAPPPANAAAPSGWGAPPQAPPPQPPRPRATRRSPRHRAPRAARLRRAWGPVASDIGVHGLAYLGVLLMFAGTLGLALFSLHSVNTSLRPLAEVALPLVLLVSSWFLARRGAPLVAASLGLLGGAVLPVLVFASLLDGSSIPPDLEPGP